MVPNIFALDRGCEKMQELCDLLLVMNWCLVRIMGIFFFFCKELKQEEDIYLFFFS